MSNKLKKIIKAKYERLKKVMQRLSNPEESNTMPQPALQPIKVRKNF